MPLKKRHSPAKQIQSQTIERDYKRKKSTKKTYLHAKTCTYTYKIMNDHMQKNAHTNAKKYI